GGVVVEGGSEAVEGAGQEQGGAVRGRAHDGLGGDIAAGAGAVLDDERLAEPFRQKLADQPRHDVDVVARGESDDDVHRPARIGLRLRRRRSQGKHAREKGGEGAAGEQAASVSLISSAASSVCSLSHRTRVYPSSAY